MITILTTSLIAVSLLQRFISSEGSCINHQENSYISHHVSIGDPSFSPSSVSSPLVILATSIHICQLLEAIAPFIQVVVVLVLV